MKRILAVLTCGLAACIEANLTVCPGEYACAPGLVCDLAHHGCVAQDQLDACAGMTDLVPCTAGTVTGECFDQVCLAPGCGNRVVEAGEQCDDGNHVSGDGCSIDCTSNETCGNGVLDVARGEQCDDGNFAAHDGCDSRCTLEAPSFDTIPITINLRIGANAAFDASRGRLVVALSQTVWEWDGSWHVVLATAPATPWDALVYDSDHHRIVGLGRDLASKPVVATWDGTAWTSIAMDVPGPTTIGAVTYDSSRHVIVALEVGNASMALIDVDAGVWKSGELATPFTASSKMRVAFNAMKATLVLLDPATATTWEMGADGLWSSTAVLPPASADWAMTYDPSLGTVVALGGTLGIDFDGSIVAWDGQKWLEAGTMPKRGGAMAWFDPVTSHLGAVGGVDSTGPLHDVLDIATTGAVSPSPAAPTAGGKLVYDATHHRLAMFGSEVWTYDGAWHLGGAIQATPLAYDPVRGGIVAVDFTGHRTYLLGDTWQDLGIAAPSSLLGTVAGYDYGNRRVVLVDPIGTHVLPSTGAAWTDLGAGVIAPGVVVYDRGAATLTLLTGNTATLFDLVNGVWQPSLSPGSSYTSVAALDRGSILLVPSSYNASFVHAIWERRRGVFTSLGAMPVQVFTLDGAAELAHGHVVLALHDSDATYIVGMRYAGAAADETCAPGDDADGDGLSGCDDPDCWESCWPACPYATSCAS